MPPAPGDPVVASFGHQRAAELVVEAFPAIAAAVPSARLWLVGAEFSAGQMEPLLERLAAAPGSPTASARRAGSTPSATASGSPRPRSRSSRGFAPTASAPPRSATCCAPACRPSRTRGAHADGIPEDAIARVPAGAGAAELAGATVALLATGSGACAMRDAALALRRRPRVRPCRARGARGARGLSGGGSGRRKPARRSVSRRQSHGATSICSSLVARVAAFISSMIRTRTACPTRSRSAASHGAAQRPNGIDAVSRSPHRGRPARSRRAV